MIEVLSNGALNLVEDLGRAGHLSKGVCAAGAMDASALRYANALLGNLEDAAGIEICIFPFKVKFLQDTWVAATGASTTLALGSRCYPSWWAFLARAGEVLSIAPPQLGSRVALAFRGGIDVPPMLSSRSTDLKGGFGGFAGRGLRKGDRIKLLDPHSDGLRTLGIAPPTRTEFANELATGTVQVRVIAASEYEVFTQEARDSFTASPYKLTPDCNRQGYRLEGAQLKVQRAVELLSHGIAPGTVQVPPAGQPIVQLAEANTIGGYPKIATVIEPDLWRLAQLRPGQHIQFVLVDHDAGMEASRHLSDEHARIRNGLQVMLPHA